jgi:hypothetical protein
MVFYEDNAALFTEGNLSYALEQHVAKAAAFVDKIPQAQFMASTDDQVVSHVVSEMEITPLELDVDAKTLQHEEAQVDVSHDPTRLFFDHDGPFYVPGTRLTVSIPYTGQPELWRIAPGHFWVTHPRANVMSPGKEGVGAIEIILEHPADVESHEPIQRLLDDTLGEIDQCLQAQRAEIDRRNGELPGAIRTAIDLRRQSLRQGSVIAAALNIPLKQREGVPDVARIAIRRKLKKPLPSTPKPGEPPQPGIADEDYEHMLNVIRHEGRTFEATPATYLNLGEEDLRNILLAHLNGHYEGAATGETFRNAGKTDIRIEDSSRAAFVAECKVWRGASEIVKALEQLLSYLTWRDAKAALIIFNKDVAGFTELLTKTSEALRGHTLYRSDLGTNHNGEWRSSFASARDNGMVLTVHTFIFNLFVG